MAINTGSNPKAMSGKGPTKSKAATRKPASKSVPASRAFDDMSAKTTVAQDKAAAKKKSKK